MAYRVCAYRPFLVGIGLILPALLGCSELSAQAPPPAFAKSVPENLRDLRNIQNHVQDLVKFVTPAVVGVRVGNAQGSGIIIDKEGHVLTAGHVSGKPGQEVVVLLSSGKEVRGRSLGSNLDIDSGMIKITEPGEWPYVGIGKSSQVRTGDWCICLGHPLGYQKGRAPVVRLGRVLEAYSSYLRTDTPLVGGDSGGPLIDMHGKVIGIHSRIGDLLSANIHVPADTYREQWDKLAKGEQWGNNLFDRPTGAYLGIRVDGQRRVTLVASESPAERAGLRLNDRLNSLQGLPISGGEDLEDFLRTQRPGSEVIVQIVRGDEIINVRLVLGKRPS